ncbi:MAG TPA: V-type ATP synthase subunit F [bacterium]|nr:V-type ATP synthase subunit F [bacterium]HNT66881.1 V-type ATP synthase subunit F [bacterium]HOX85752.1 V-type ATP synthase subunit F [bacterium]HPG44911.1 V-type ATP synthase subunit F [bacterium]HPM98060.1 V-type ATP synthase subunit F [bacterium]
MKYFVIGDEDTVLGFGLVGVKGHAVKNESEANNTLQEALKDKQIGIIIITERVAEWIRQFVDSYLFSTTFPLIVEIPDRSGPMEGRPGIRQMVNEAIGVKL